jgi:hypothetical protein
MINYIYIKVGTLIAYIFHLGSEAEGWLASPMVMPPSWK